uniref:Uncharacterized protein n=1 Tax=Rousettus aegyptiacus TaxID=9407 RepID=A0A7J8FI04_ROUAE|nr:hypothetical protein HJG63_011845 [Rousettus aegyptiacus]
MAGATLTPKITIRRRLPKSVRVILIAVLVMTAVEVENMAQLRPIQEARRRVWRWGEDELWFEQHPHNWSNREGRKQMEKPSFIQHKFTFKPRWNETRKYEFLLKTDNMPDVLTIVISVVSL